MRLVIIESPFAGDIKTNLLYLRAAMRDCIYRDEAPYASHALYTQPGVLDDGSETDRTLGIRAGFAWRKVADATVVYQDLGISRGMELGIQAAEGLDAWCEERKLGRHPVEVRVLGDGWKQRALEVEAATTTRWPGHLTEAQRLCLRALNTFVGQTMSTTPGPAMGSMSVHGLELISEMADDRR